MMARFSRFVVSVIDFCESKYSKIRIYFVLRKDLFHYEVFYKRGIA